MADWFAPVIFSGHTLVLGLVFYWIARRKLGRTAAIPVLLTSWVVLTLKWGQPFSSSVLMLEGLFVGLVWSRGRSPWLAEFMFWLCLGTPLSWFVYQYVYPIPHPAFEHALVVQVANGFVSLWIAIVATDFLPFFAPPNGKDSKDNFRSFLLKRYLAFSTIPVLISGIVAAQQYESSAIETAENNLVKTAEKLALTIGNELEEAYDAVNTASARLSHLDKLGNNHDISIDLVQAHARTAVFVTMLVADYNGKVVAASRRDEKGVIRSVDGISVIPIVDREYFSVPMKTGSPYFSDVFQGRGLGQDVLVALSTPVIDASGNRLGIVEGSCRVSTIDAIIAREGLDASWRVLVSDQKMKVISSVNFGRQAMSSLEGTALSDLVRSQTAAKPKRYTADIKGGRYSLLSVSVVVPRAGWTITVQRDWGEILLPIIRVYIAMLLVALATALVAVGFTVWSIRDFLGIWKRLLALTADPYRNSHGLINFTRTDLPTEFNELALHFSNMADRLKIQRVEREQLLVELETRVQTRTKELQTALVAAQAADKAKSSFLATMSHELRTPLTSIITGTALLKMSRTARTGVEDRTLQTLEKSSHVLMSVISNVLDFSKLESGNVTVKNEPFQPATVVTDVVTILTPTAKQAGLSFDIETSQQPELQWKGDEALVRQVLVNLAGNAVKFTERGSIKISTRVTNDAAPRLYFSVQDSGRGIPPEHLNSIFDPFVQLPQDRMPSQAGTGLGLPISRKLVQAMGGEITVSSRSGEGSTFEFWIS